MADKIVLNKALGTYDVAQINNNFDKIAKEFNDKVLYRDNPPGTANQAKSNIDMNGFHIINLPAPGSSNEAARLKDVTDAIAGLGGKTASTVSFSPSTSISADNVQGAIEEVNSHVDQKTLQLAVNVREFGAVGDGVADDTLAIQTAINTYGEAFIPRGMNCRITSPITLSIGQKLYGARSSLPNGAPQSKITMSSDATAILCEVGSGYNHVHDLFIDGPGASKANSIGIQCIHNSFSQFERLFIRGFHYGVWDDAVQANVYRDLVINSVFYGVYWYSGYVQDYHQNCTYERIYVSGISDTGFLLNGGTSVDSLCKGNAFRECAADGAAQNGWSVIRVLDTGFYNCYTELFAVTGYYFQDCKNCHVHGFFAGAGSATATTGTRCLHVVNSTGLEFRNFTLRGDKYPGGDGAYAQHIYFQGGKEYSNSLTNYMREDTASTTINITSTNTLTSLQKVGALSTIHAGAFEGDSLVLNAATPVGGVGQVALGKTLSFGASAGTYAVPPTAVGYLVVNVNGQNYNIPFYNQ